MNSNTTNPQLELAYNYVSKTDKNIFLTGKAGTGKTTFLHRIKGEAVKRMVVVAPTGVAAINAGGMTIHSLFQLPFGPQVPGMAKPQNRKFKFSGKKIDLLRSIDLLVIDEISMVRADLLDSIDGVLRRYRDFSKPFGGVQLLMIGDLNQLPPVVKQEEWELLRQHYQTPYFFGSLALQQTDPVTIELKHIFRQSDERFINLLNKVRDNQLDSEVLTMLNSRYRANFQPAKEDGYITLTAHNSSAQQINVQRLTALEGQPQQFRAKIEGNFPAHAYPTDEVLELKTGAQVMFVKNDPEKRFYNGKIGQVTRMEDDAIYVKCPGDEDDICVLTMEWSNVKYKLNERSKEVEEEQVGSFTQFPLKLAWAITIHKSQGLTFERAIIDAQAAFAHGQVYVALSRCKSFEGIVLRSKIAFSSVKTDAVVKKYNEEAERNAPDENDLEQSKREYQQKLVLELFDFGKMKSAFGLLRRVLLEHASAFPDTSLNQLDTLEEQAGKALFSVAQNFRSQLNGYLAQPGQPEENAGLQERLKKACTYFMEKLGKELFPLLKDIHIVSDNQAAVKKAHEKLANLRKVFFIKNACLKTCREGFSTPAYIRAKADADLDFSASKKSSSSRRPTSGIPKDIPHPALYARLLKWREKVAAKENITAYEVLSVRVILDITRSLPTGTPTLKKVRGLGDLKIKRYGANLLDMVDQYVRENNIPSNQLDLQPPVPVAKPDTKRISLDLFRSGKNMDEIAAGRSLVRSTIEGHLAHFVGLGELDISKLVEAEKVAELLAFYKGKESRISSEAKEHFGEKYSYGEIKLVLSHLKYLEESPS